VELDPTELTDLDAAPTVSHMDDHGNRVDPDALPRLDLVLSGSVGVTPAGTRIGKGEGYSDLEYAILHDLGLVGSETTIATTVHDDQVLDSEAVPDPDDHDVPVDVIVTPTRVIRTGAERRPAGVDWAALSTAQLAEMPVLRHLRDDH
jgi:5-formyltetrahydrofolate cyclo-ligase